MIKDAVVRVIVVLYRFVMASKNWVITVMLIPSVSLLIAACKTGALINRKQIIELISQNMTMS